LTHKAQKLFNKKDLLAYLFVAGTGACVQLLFGSLFQDWFSISYKWSIPPAYFVSLIVGFILTKLFAFDVRNTEKTQREMVKFLMVSLFSGLLMWVTAIISLQIINYIFPKMELLMPFSEKRFHIDQLLSTIAGMGISFISNYYLHKTFTFKNTGFYDRLKTVLK
jgi:putative flippase GtrA